MIGIRFVIQIITLFCGLQEFIKAIHTLELCIHGYAVLSLCLFFIVFKNLDNFSLLSINSESLFLKFVFSLRESFNALFNSFLLLQDHSHLLHQFHFLEVTHREIKECQVVLVRVCVHGVRALQRLVRGLFPTQVFYPLP